MRSDVQNPFQDVQEVVYDALNDEEEHSGDVRP